jgi:hypothetical protein
MSNDKFNLTRELEVLNEVIWTWTNSYSTGDRDGDREKKVFLVRDPLNGEFQVVYTSNGTAAKHSRWFKSRAAADKTFEDILDFANYKRSQICKTCGRLFNGEKSIRCPECLQAVRDKRQEIREEMTLGMQTFIRRSDAWESIDNITTEDDIKLIHPGDYTFVVHIRERELRFEMSGWYEDERRDGEKFNTDWALTITGYLEFKYGQKPQGGTPQAKVSTSGTSRPVDISLRYANMQLWMVEILQDSKWREILERNFTLDQQIEETY